MQQISLHFVTQDQIDELFKRLAIADSINKNLFQCSEEGYLFFAKRVASEILAICKPEYSSDIFKLEVQYCLNRCFQNKELTETFGEPFFARGNNFLKIMTIIEECVKESLDHFDQ